MIFTEDHKKAAIAFEELTGAMLARYFFEKLQGDDVMNNVDLKNCSLAETAEFVNKFAAHAETHERNIKLLDDIQKGKYRLLFTALAAGMDEAHKVIKDNIDKDEIRNYVKEAFDLGED